LPKEFENKLILGSAENMKELPNNSIHLMITSPPYNACLCTQLLTALTQNAQYSMLNVQLVALLFYLKIVR